MIVVDASAALSALLNAGPARRALASEQLHAPHLIDSEVANALRRRVAARDLEAAAGWTALDTMRRLGMTRYPVFSILDRVWELRANLSAYDASYVALAELLVAGGERVGIPGLINPTASRSVIDKMAQAMLHDDAARPSLPPSFVPSALAEIVVLSDFWSPIEEIRTMLAGLSASGAHGALVQIVDPAEESFPYSGRVEFVEPEGRGIIVAGRAEKWAGDYVARVALHREQIRSETSKLDWLFSTHTTSRSAAELLLFLHSGMMVNKGSTRAATVKAGRSA